MAFLLISSSLALALAFMSSLLLSLSDAQDPRAQYSRAPHGLAFENPIAFPPSAIEFFHPHYARPAGTEAPLPTSSLPEVSSKAKADQVFTWPGAPSRRRLGAGGVVAVVLGIAFAVLIAAGASYVVIKRRFNGKRAKAIIQPDA